MAEPEVSVVVPSWNGLADTLECLASLRGHDFSNLDVILVDNGSRDGTPERVRTEFPEVRVAENKRNVGFARACNDGARLALENGADYLFFINNDATVDRGCVRELLSVAREEKDVGVVGVLAHHATDPSAVDGGHRINWWTAQITEAENALGEPRTLDVDYVWGCGLFVSAHLFGRLGGFRELYGSYYEDADLCLRARRLGYRTVVATRATIRHKVSRSGDRVFLRQTYLRARNMLLFFLLNSPRHTLPLAVPLCLFWRIPRFLYDSLHLYLAHRLLGRFRERSITLFEPRANRETG